MKRIVLLLTLFTSLQGKSQIVELMFENFNNGFPSGWQRFDQDGLIPQAATAFVTNAWTVIENLDSTGTGDSVLIATSYYNPAGMANDWLLLPPITLKSNGNRLEFQVKSQDPSYPDSYQVLVNTSAAVIDSFDIQNPVYANTAEYGVWTDRSIDLDTFANQTVYIAFRLNSTDKFLLMLDDVHVYADTLLSVDEGYTAASVKVYPNPATDQVQIMVPALEKARYEMVDISGRVITGGTLQQGQNSLQRGSWNAGWYLLRIMTDNSRQSVPLIWH